MIQLFTPAADQESGAGGRSPHRAGWLVLVEMPECAVINDARELLCCTTLE